MTEIETVKIVCAVSIFVVAFLGAAFPIFRKLRERRNGTYANVQSSACLDCEKRAEEISTATVLTPCIDRKRAASRPDTATPTPISAHPHPHPHMHTHTHADTDTDSVFDAAAESFAAGVVLCAGIVHVLGDACGSFDAASLSSEYPFALLICASVVLLLVSVQVILDAYLLSRSGSQHDSQDGATDGAMRTVWLLFGALAVHSVLEGLALGAEQDVAGTTTIVAAILAHKGFAAFALGIRMAPIYASAAPGPSSRTQIWILITLFSTASPAGCFVGMGVRDALDHSVSGLVAQGCLLAAAAGSFLFIATFEMIPHSFSRGKLVWNISSAWIGFAVFSTLAIWV
eukprot:ANDGO_01195.mRNA.1 Zinc transporter 3